MSLLATFLAKIIPPPEKINPNLEEIDLTPASPVGNLRVLVRVLVRVLDPAPEREAVQINPQHEITKITSASSNC